MSAKRGKKKGRATPRGEATKRRAKEAVNPGLMKALSHEVRVQILALLNSGEWSPNQLHKELGVGLSQISYHIKVLRDYELIEMTKTEPRRGAVEHFYKSVERVLIPEDMAEALPKAAKLEALRSTMMLADNDMRGALKSGKFYERSDLHVSWSPLDVDEEGRAKLHTLLDELVDEAIKTEEESLNRIAKGEGEAIPTSLVMYAFSSDRKTSEQASTFRQRT